MKPDERQAIRDTKNALSALLLTATFAADPDVWPAFVAFVAFVERNTGREYNVTAESMSLAIRIADALRTDLAQTITSPSGRADDRP
jgi:hypothetical protein